MRIIKIEIENLNSLKGHWTIDFTHPDYNTFHNLFVISGDTGSGKTTILDAITLALYGKTPRQKSVSKSENEIMTRHTGFCRAVVTYECKAGKFESEFYQQKARKNPEGSLQAPECRIQNLIDGKEETQIAATKLEERTAAIIQLDYQQFTRSIMLAQGEFDTFISGDDRQRAAILSKLNGTEHYKEIGRRICERAKTYRNETEDAAKEFSGIEIFSDEQTAELEKEKLSKINENAEIKSKLDKISKELQWLEEIKKNKSDFENAKLRRTEYENKAEAFKADEEKLTLAEKAGKCNADYVAWFQTNENLLSKKHSLEEATNTLSDLTEKFTAAENAFNDSQKKLSGAEESISENRKLWKEVRETDSELRYAQENLKKAQSEKQSAEKTLSEQKKNREAIAHDIKEAEKEYSALNEYLKENEKDSELEQLVFKLESENNSFIKLTRDVNEKTKAISSNNNLIASKSEEKNTLQKDLDSLNSELKNLVSTEFKTVSLLIKNQLTDGKPCPVCGSLSHPSCVAASETNSIDEQNQKVASDISGLNKKIDEAEKNITTLAAEINALTEKSGQLESEKNQLMKELESSGEKLNTLIAPWNYSITQKDFEQLPEIINVLSLRNKKFSENTKLKDELENKKKILETKLEAIDLKKLETSLSDAEKIFIDAENNYKTILKKRHELFGEKNVDAEEQSAEENVLALKKSASQKESEKNTILQAKTKVTADIENFTKDIKTLSEKSEEALRKFNETLSKNSFASREEFLAFRMKDSEIENLNTIKQSLIKMDGETKNALETARNALEKLSGENLSQKTEAELLESQNQCIKIQEENSEKIGSITTQLEFNSAQKDKAAVAKKKLEDARKKSDLWNEMADFIGKKADGSDFEVFVEALAFKQLLKIANRYVEAITKQYTLVQVEGKVDFLIHDINYPDSKDDRPVNNMSGGEKFIISLSLALGIAELASRNVRVDSLFLDEGFGTLSGEPLMEAITALKSLQNSGKMLGIITHIDTVIREFDLKIEAGKNLSGVSELKGPGVSHEV